ncbi:MAG TPA: hypothetical protein VMS63_01915 [Gaiellaceae bacterium]|nr:hypothetical protein [Gaiellaceae bacterium]
MDDADVRAALARCAVAQTAPRREGFTAFNARSVAREVAAQTGAGWMEMPFELRRWAASVGGVVKPKDVDPPPTTPRPLFLYVPDRLVPRGEARRGSLGRVIGE